MNALRIDPVKRPATAYAAPMVVFLVATQLEAWLATTDSGAIDGGRYLLAYTIKMALVVATLFWCRPALASFVRVYEPRRSVPTWAVAGASLSLGVGIGFGWVFGDPYYPHFDFLGQRTGFDPTTLEPAQRIGFAVVRGLGLVLVVPLLEELFVRSLIMRYIIDPDRFADVPTGRVTPLAGGLTAVLFTLTHPEWLAALLTGLAWSALLAWSGRLWSCLISHAVANLTLGLIVAQTGQWSFL